MNQAVTRIEQTAADTRLNAQGAQVPAGRAVVSVAHDADEQARIDSQPFGEHAIAVRPGNVEFELLTPAQFSIYGVVVRGDVLRHYAEAVERVPLDARLPCAPTVRAGAARLAQLCALLAQRLGDTDAGNAMLSDVERDDVQAELLAALFDACTAHDDGSGNADALGDPPSRRRWIVGQARDYVLAHRSRPVGVPELCEQLHVSRRTLQYCFQDVLGMAPATYLRALRLNGARRDLCGRAAGSVQDVAAAWGFWHLSQFATDYRRMFGMRPSEALRAA